MFIILRYFKVIFKKSKIRNIKIDKIVQSKIKMILKISREKSIQ